MAEEWPGKPVDEGEWPGKPAGTTSGDFVGSVGGGFNVGLSEALGAPVDLMNLGLGAVGLGTERPFAGSTSIRQGLSNLGMAPAPGQPYPVPFVGRVAEEVGAGTGALMPFMGIAQRGTAAAQVARAAKPGTSAVKRAIIDPALRMAQQSPKTLAAAETAAATSAGVGAAVAQQLFPGDPTAELVGQLAGGFLNPTGMLISQAPRVGRGAKNIVYPFTKQGAKRQAAGRVQELSKQPETSLQRLRDYEARGPVIEGERLSPAQITQDPGLLALERAAARSSHEIEGELGEMAAATNRALLEEASRIRTPTDPGEVRGFLQQRQKITEDLLDQRMQNAALKARQRVESLAPEARRAQANVIAREELEGALTDARVSEKELWADVPSDTNAGTESAFKAYQDFQRGRGKAADPEDIPEFVRRHIGGIEDDLAFEAQEPIQELRDLRSRVLREGRNERGQTAPNWNKVRFLDNVGDALLEDMSNVPGANPALERARDFSRNLNEKFQRGSVGKILGYERVGGATVAPEMTLERSIGRLGPGGDVAAKELLQAVEKNPEQMRGAAADYLRGTFLQQVDPTSSGRINPAAARTWMNRNSALMDRFPELRQQFMMAAGDEDAARRLAETTKTRTKSINDRLKSSTAMWVKAQPGQEIERIRSLGGSRGGAAMRSLVNAARKDPTGNAMKGLKSAYIEDLMRRAYSSAEDVEGLEFLDGKKMLNLLNEDKALTGNLLTPADKTRLTQIAQRAELLQDARRKGKDINAILESESNALFDMLARISGAQIGGRLGAGAAGTPLVAAGAGSRFMRNVTEKIPLERVSDVLVQASQDNRLMADLLSRTDTDAKALPVGRRLNAWLINAIPEYEDVYGDQSEPVEITIHPGAPR